MLRCSESHRNSRKEQPILTHRHEVYTDLAVRFPPPFTQSADPDFRIRRGDRRGRIENTANDALRSVSEIGL
jgi:hypothetical protein